MLRNTLPTVLMLCAGLLSGCVSFQTAEQTQFHYQSWPQRKAALAQMTRWSVSGAFSVQPASGHAAIANYQWQQHRHDYTIHIEAPLDLKSIKIVGSSKRVTVWGVQDKPQSAPNARALMQKELGWQVPINDMAYWIRGLSAPGKAVTTLDQYGHLKTLRQAGWLIHFSRYLTRNGVDLPQTLTIDGMNYHIKLVARW